MEFMWKIRPMLEKSKSSRPNITNCKGVETHEIFEAQQRLVFFRLTKATAQWCWMTPNTKIS
jgi:hypothetical protein